VVCVCIERTRLFAIAANWRCTIWRASKLFKSKASAVVIGKLLWTVLVRGQIIHVFASVCFKWRFEAPVTFAAADLAMLISAQPTREVTPDWRMPLLASTTACRTGLAASTAAAAPAIVLPVTRWHWHSDQRGRRVICADSRSVELTALPRLNQQQRYGTRIDLYEFRRICIRRTSAAGL